MPPLPPPPATEDAAIALLLARRWPDGFRCACGGRGHRLGRTGRGGVPWFQCACCRMQTSLTTDTPLAASKLPLVLWLRAAHALAGDAPPDGPALAAALGLSDKAAGRLRDAVTLAMVAAQEIPAPGTGVERVAVLAPLRGDGGLALLAAADAGTPRLTLWRADAATAPPTAAAVRRCGHLEGAAAAAVAALLPDHAAALRRMTRRGHGLRHSGLWLAAQCFATQPAPARYDRLVTALVRPPGR